MTTTSKYGLKIKENQFGHSVAEDYIDGDEMICINKFEEICIKLKSELKEKYTMIELGSNQAYYSLLFRAIIDGVGHNEKCVNILLEPTPENMERGKSHFIQNGFEGIYENAGIGHYWCWDVRWHDKTLPSYTIDQLMAKNGLDELDILHSDIDGNEIRLLETSTDVFKQKKIRYIFLSTHGIWTEKQETYISDIIKIGEDRHVVCKDFLLNCGYNLILESPHQTVGGDGLLIFNKN